MSGFQNQDQSSEKAAFLAQLIDQFSDETHTAEPDQIRELIEVCVGLLGQLSKSSDEETDLSLTLLCNLSISEGGSRQLLDVIFPTGETLNEDFKYGFEKFLHRNPQLEDSDGSNTKLDALQHMASIMCNITRLEDGRKILLKQSWGYMNSFIKQIRSANIIRRRGTIASIRNCLFDTEVHWWLVNEVDIVTHLLLPLVVPTPFEEKEKVGMSPVLWLAAMNPAKKHEPDTDIIVMLLECIVLLCQKRMMREELRKRKAYFVCRNLDYQLQEIEAINKIVYDIVNFLMRDEDPYERDDAEAGASSTADKLQEGQGEGSAAAAAGNDASADDATAATSNASSNSEAEI
jgi:hypothetical protein